MDSRERKKHWETVFETKDTRKVSWYQAKPKTSLKLIEKLNLNKTDRIIEIGSGDGSLGDHLLQKGYSQITFLDISDKALKTVKARLGKKSNNLFFMSGDVINFQSLEKYKLWHDRAVFHFITDKKDIQKYVKNVSNSLEKGGYLILGTFSKNGPTSCSNLNVQQYSEIELKQIFRKDFVKIKCINENHITPIGSKQNFLFCIFQRK